MASLHQKLRTRTPSRKNLIDYPTNIEPVTSHTQKNYSAMQGGTFYKIFNSYNIIGECYGVKCIFLSK